MRFPPAVLCGAVGGFFWAGGRPAAGECVLARIALAALPGLLGVIVVGFGLRRSAGLLTCLHAGHSFCPHGGGIWHANFSCDDNVASDVEGHSGCLNASCPMR